MTYYSHISHHAPGPGGTTVLHLSETVSPEYGAANDTNYDVALLKWGLAAVLDAVDKVQQLRHCFDTFFSFFSLALTCTTWCTFER